MRSSIGHGHSDWASSPVRAVLENAFNVSVPQAGPFARQGRAGTVPLILDHLDVACRHRIQLGQVGRPGVGNVIGVAIVGESRPVNTVVGGGFAESAERILTSIPSPALRVAKTSWSRLSLNSPLARIVNPFLEGHPGLDTKLAGRHWMAGGGSIPS